MPAAATFSRSLREVGGSDRLGQRVTSLLRRPISSTVTTGNEVDAPRAASPQIKAAPARRLTRRWPFCC